MATQDPLETDWIHGVFEVLREELISLAADFGERVKEEIDQVAAVENVRPPSAVALLASVALETGNFAGSLLVPPGATDEPIDEEDT